jgi:hypothetical protein
LLSRLLSKNVKINIYETINLPVVLYGPQTYFFALGEERRLRVFENRVLRRIFGSKNEIIRSWREFHNEELLNFPLLAKYNLPDQVMEVGRTGHVACMGEKRSSCRFFRKET